LRSRKEMMDIRRHLTKIIIVAIIMVASNKIRNNANIEQTTAANVATSGIYVVRDVASQEETWKKKIMESESKN